MTIWTLVLQLLLPATPVVTYVDVPGEVTRVAVFEWREGSAPTPVAAHIDRAAARVSVRGLPRRPTIITFARRDAEYLLDGPFAWPSADSTRTVAPRWHRSVRGPIPEAAAAAAAMEWIQADVRDGPWPRCFREDARSWTCWGLVKENRGVIVMPDAARLWWAIVGPSNSTGLRSAGWGRLLVTTESAGAGNVRVILSHPVTPPVQRLRGFRLETAAVSGAQAVALGGGSAWLSGTDVPPGSWAEVATDRSGPVYLSLRDIADGAVSVPLHVPLAPSRVVQGTVRGAAGEAAAQALVTVFRLIDPPPAQGSRSVPRRVFAAETVADGSGAFQVARIGEAEYEIVAWHARFGRASVPLGAAESEVAIHLRASGIARGRVLAGGRPADGVSVVSVPDAATFNAVQDITDVKGGDARTGPDGRFSVMVAAAGGGELRIGGGTYAVRRVPLPRPPLPVLDLGDIDLGTSIDVIVLLDRDPGCAVRAAGPAGRTGLQLVTGVPTGDGGFRVALPEAGLWEFGLVCAGGRRLLSPGAVQIGAPHAGKELRFQVR